MRPRVAFVPTGKETPDDVELRYPGTCANKHLAEEKGRGIRVRLTETTERFVDLVHGPQQQRPVDQCGDLLVRDPDGNLVELSTPL